MWKNDILQHDKPIKKSGLRIRILNDIYPLRLILQLQSNDKMIQNYTYIPCITYTRIIWSYESYILPRV